jgi:hypothetical protein
MTREYETRESGGGFLFPQWTYIAFVKGADCETDPCGYGPTPEAAIEDLCEILED